MKQPNSQPTQTIMSGIQPTGTLHIGNYLGAVNQWLTLQNSKTSDVSDTNTASTNTTTSSFAVSQKSSESVTASQLIFSIVDYHAITAMQNVHDARLLRETTEQLTLSLVALGIKPENLCIQSLIPEHAELMWILNCFCSYGELSRMTQFKDKADSMLTSDNKAFVSAGLFNYPVLQAADILLYRATHVPVGEDQLQHLELTKHIASRFNSVTGSDYFQLPSPLLSVTPKIMSLADPNRKMSKSLGDKHYLGVFDDEATVRAKIRVAVTDNDLVATGTDSEGRSVTEVQYTEGDMSSGVKNLFRILSAFDVDAYNEQLSLYQQGILRYGQFKQVLTTAISKFTTHNIEQLAIVTANKTSVLEQIRESSLAKRAISQQTLREVKDLVGLFS